MAKGKSGLSMIAVALGVLCVAGVSWVTWKETQRGYRAHQVLSPEVGSLYAVWLEGGVISSPELLVLYRIAPGYEGTIMTIPEDIEQLATRSYFTCAVNAYGGGEYAVVETRRARARLIDGNTRRATAIPEALARWVATPSAIVDNDVQIFDWLHENHDSLPWTELERRPESASTGN